MKKLILLIMTGLLSLLVLVSAILWIGGYNRAIKAQKELPPKQAQIYVAYSGRYEKVAAYIDAIEGERAQIIAQINLITDARSRFADAIASKNYSEAEAEVDIIESTFISLVSYMEDNPASWNTVGLTGGFMAEFAASTNAVMFAINQYNMEVAKYNTIISLFPNNIFLRNFNEIDDLVVPEYNTVLPTFN